MHRSGTPLRNHHCPVLSKLFRSCQLLLQWGRFFFFLSNFHFATDLDKSQTRPAESNKTFGCVNPAGSWSIYPEKWPLWCEILYFRNKCGYYLFDATFAFFIVTHEVFDQHCHSMHLVSWETLTTANLTLNQTTHTHTRHFRSHKCFGYLIWHMIIFNAAGSEDLPLKIPPCFAYHQFH